MLYVRFFSLLLNCDVRKVFEDLAAIVDGEWREIICGLLSVLLVLHCLEDNASFQIAFGCLQLFVQLTWGTENSRCCSSFWRPILLKQIDLSKRTFSQFEILNWLFKIALSTAYSKLLFISLKLITRSWFRTEVIYVAQILSFSTPKPKISSMFGRASGPAEQVTLLDLLQFLYLKFYCGHLWLQHLVLLLLFAQLDFMLFCWVFVVFQILIYHLSKFTNCWFEIDLFLLPYLKFLGAFVL